MTASSAKPAKCVGGSMILDVAIERFHQYLRDNNLKCTPERDRILSELLAAERHVEADGLLVRLHQGGHRVSRATIYRTLELLVTAGLARKIRLGTGHYHFEQVLSGRRHEHMICLDCDRVIEWYDPDLERVLDRNLEANGFAATRRSLQIFGTCEACLADTADSTAELGTAERERPGRP